MIAQLTNKLTFLSKTIKRIVGYRTVSTFLLLLYYLCYIKASFFHGNFAFVELELSLLQFVIGIGGNVIVIWIGIYMLSIHASEMLYTSTNMFSLLTRMVGSFLV
ncbi:hypothetical protein Ddye_024835 [Dipteronia dyeriana]|uniref:Uncharacterized protein n=1 Tax=Dipteronia dyeriana TaxID=168575 RepID=A0AAD9TVS8_9ROSI|nr:hypothetical protein Ddye_024835 [Dipteronia dyeriana]